MLQYLQATNYIDIIAGDFSYDPLKVSQNKSLDVFRDRVHVMNNPRQISGYLIDHAYIKKALMDIFTNVTVEN